MKSKRTIGNWPFKNEHCFWLRLSLGLLVPLLVKVTERYRSVAQRVVVSMYYIVVAENMSTSPTRPKTAAKAIDKRAE